ncbi:ribosomal protein S18 acetylase RimI-like enzyme [Planomicrobium soli]|uniref:Ribosomal protein S18 acetylase RimI-like enzyme n=1 Tax=Planomicrobium soli TaxID=1176648 RepID=A0A2P8GK29_9BACL|nr:GNAT family N-acetyltransferase [Planomicrobium soli]PSL34318.1 ribosomal protein S18 acetylase RimI-like enzyme [Planomicrobium soli]
MIQQLNNRQEQTAQAMWAIQIPAYKIEAELIDFKEIPPLKETVEDIQNSDETFIGFFDEELKGFISYKKEGELVDIHRLVINPQSFRQGIATQLIAFLISEFPNHKFIVNTGKANIPAKKLYISLGFNEHKDFEVAPGIWCTELLLNN